MAITNTFYTDATIRRAIYVERLKAGQRINYDKVIATLVQRLQRIMTIYNVDNVSDLSGRQMTRLLNEMHTALDEASYTFVKRLLSWLKQFGREQNDWNELLMDKTLETNTAAVNYNLTNELIFTGLVGSTGLTVEESLDALVETQKKYIEKKIKTAAAQNRSMTDTVKDIIGTKSQNYRDGLMSQLRNFGHEMVGSVIQFAANATNMAYLDKFQDYVTGYMWVSVLDNRTSATCRSLDGQVFKTGEGPVPPAHPNCRSHITAVFNSDVSFIKGTTRKAIDGAIDAGVSYYQWLKKQPVAFQDSVLGKTRGKLFRNGGVSADDFARLNVNRNYEQLTLDQLQRLYPEMFEEANIPLDDN